MPRRYFAKYMQESKHYSWHHYGEQPKNQEKFNLILLIKNWIKK